MLTAKMSLPLFSSHQDTPSGRVTTGLFSRPDVAKIKRDLKATSEDIGAFFGVSPSLASGWINGTRKPVGPARKLLLLIERHPDLLDELKCL